MKGLRIYFTIILAFLCLQGTTAQNNDFHFHGTLTTWGDTLVVMQPMHPEYADTIIRHNGTFDFLLPIKTSTLVDIVSLSALRNINHEQIERFLAVPGETLDYKEGHLAGSSFYQVYEQTLNHVIRDKDKPVTRESIIDYALAHADSENAVIALSEWRTNYLLTSDEMEGTYKKLSPDIQQGRLKEFFYDLVQWKRDFENKVQEAQQAESGIVNQSAPDFALPDTNGRIHRLSDYRGKYILLDFWGTWCGACVKDLPRLKQYATQYQDRMMVIGVACNDKTDSWKQCIDKHELSWLNLIQPKDDKTTQQYGVLQFPTKILITPEGKVINAPRGHGIYEFIDKLFGQKGNL